jgi:tetratricopeptide (TPR) repeat protein
LRTERHNAEADAGAGVAAFQLGQFEVASRYLQQAVAGDPNDAKSAALLKTTELLLALDPFLSGLSRAQRERIVVRDFEIAGERLKQCGMSAGAAGSASSLGTSQRSLGDSWAQMKPRVTARGFDRDPDLADLAMELVFDIERASASTCGAPADVDEALLTIAKAGEGR